MQTHTPIPFMNSQTRLSTIPSVPGTNCVVKPERSTDIGTNRPAPHRLARRRSSGIQTPPRRFRHVTTTLSERRPASGAPTVIMDSPFVSRGQEVGNGEALLMLPRPAGRKKAPMIASFEMLYCFPCRFEFSMRSVGSVSARKLTYDGIREWYHEHEVRNERCCPC